MCWLTLAPSANLSPLFFPPQNITKRGTIQVKVVIRGSVSAKSSATDHSERAGARRDGTVWNSGGEREHGEQGKCILTVEALNQPARRSLLLSKQWWEAGPTWSTGNCSGCYCPCLSEAELRISSLPTSCPSQKTSVL